MIKGQFAKNLHKAVSERGIKQVELAKVLEVPVVVPGYYLVCYNIFKCVDDGSCGCSSRLLLGML